jgi:hypothetical protein
VRHELLTKDVASIEVTEAASSASVTSMDAASVVSSSCLTTGSLGYLNGCYVFGEQLMSHYWQPRLRVASIEVTEAASSKT